MKETKVCKTCGKEFEKVYFGKQSNATWSRKIYCSQFCKAHDKCECGEFKLKSYKHCFECRNKYILGENSHMWKGGRTINGLGYVIIYQPNHPYANAGHVLEHRLVMEKHLGRYLTKEEVVHHMDGDKTNNNLTNLHLFATSGEHTAYHFMIQGFVRDEVNKIIIKGETYGMVDES
jgi:hypothetical protein